MSGTCRSNRSVQMFVVVIAGSNDMVAALALSLAARIGGAPSARMIVSVFAKSKLLKRGLSGLGCSSLKLPTDSAWHCRDGSELLRHSAMRNVHTVSVALPSASQLAPGLQNTCFLPPVSE